MAQSTLSAVRRVGRAPFLVVEHLHGPARQHAIVARGDDALAGDKPLLDDSAGRPRCRLDLDVAQLGLGRRASTT